MKQEQVEQINADAKKHAAGKKKGDETDSLDAAIAAFLDLELEFKQAGNKVPPGCDGAFYNIRYEVEQWNAADKGTREGIKAFKAAK